MQLTFEFEFSPTRGDERLVHSNGKSNLLVISVYFLFRLFFGVVRRGGSVKEVRGPVRKVVHGPGP